MRVPRSFVSLEGGVGISMNYSEASSNEVARVMAKIMAATVDEEENLVNLALTGLTILNQGQDLELTDVFKLITTVTEFTATLAATSNGRMN